jgi:S-methylmethionine-dependent homocysteine/selenocysteine methylase
MITTNNYTVVPGYYRKAFADWEDRISKDSETAARLAVEARKQAGAEQSVRVLGSLPPMAESHRPDLAAAFIANEGEEFVIKTYRAIGEALLRGGPVDCFLAETMNSWEEAHCAIEGVKDLGKPIIVSLEGALRSEKLKPQPELAADIAEKILATKAAGVPIEALCFNCAPPEDIFACLKVIDHKGYRARLHAAGIRLGVYPNIHDRKKVLDNEGFGVKAVKDAVVRVREDLEKKGFVKHMHKFIPYGVCYIGGCCGSTPEQLGWLSSSLHYAGDDGTPYKRRRLDLTSAQQLLDEMNSLASSSKPGISA